MQSILVSDGNRSVPPCFERGMDIKKTQKDFIMLWFAISNKKAPFEEKQDREEKQQKHPLHPQSALPSVAVSFHLWKRFFLHVFSIRHQATIRVCVWSSNPVDGLRGQWCVMSETGGFSLQTYAACCLSLYLSVGLFATVQHSPALPISVMDSFEVDCGVWAWEGTFSRDERRSRQEHWLYRRTGVSKCGVIHRKWLQPSDVNKAIRK